MNPDIRGTTRTVTLTASVIALCAFTFSFGNIWHLALAWGIPAPIAPLVAPMLDVSVVGLMIAIRQLALRGIPGRQLLSARLLMLACAATTWGLNIAQAVIDHRWGAVIIDSVAPALLLGWAEVGPTLLRLTTTIPAAESTSATSETPTSTSRPGARALPTPASARPSQPTAWNDGLAGDLTDEEDLPHVA
jgi:hypothetical protein